MTSRRSNRGVGTAQKGIRLWLTALLWGSLVASCAGPGAGGRSLLAYDKAMQEIESGIVAALKRRASTRIAILPLEAEGDVAMSVGALAIDTLAAALATAPNVTFVERDKLRAIIEEMALQQSGLVDESHQIELGKMAGAEVLLTLRSTFLGDRVDIRARLMDVAGGTALAGFSTAILVDDALQAAIADRRARKNVRTSKEVMAAFGALRAGELEEAEAVFAPLAQEEGERRSVGTMGMAALAYERQEPSRAVELCQISRQLSDSPSYCWVIEGRVAFERGDREKASSLFNRALADSGTLIDWQKSIAANGLGLTAMAQGQPDAALELYDKAVSLDPTHLQALSNKARILEERGDLATAIMLYQRGLKVDPDDAVLALLLRDAQLRMTFTQDKARQQKIAALADKLVAGKSQPRTETGANRDGWTSRPVSVTVLPIVETGVPAGRLGETAFLESSLRASLESVTGVQIVDRELLSQVLEEMQLGISQLGDPKAALNVGRILSARALVGGTIVRMQGEAQITLRLIETETTRVLATISEIFAGSTRLSKVAAALAPRLQEKMRSAFPLRGRVTGRKGNRVKINVGAALGTTMGTPFAVYDAGRSSVLCTGKVVEVHDGHAWLEVDGDAKAIPTRAPVERRL